MLLNSTTVFISGAAKRVGRSLALAFAAAGSKLIIHYSKSASEANALLNELGGTAKGHRTVSCDLSDVASVESLRETLFLSDILINNASVFDMKSLAAESYAEALRQYNINFFAPFEMMKIFRSGCLEQNSKGLVINMLDQRIVKNDPLGASYSLSKKSLAELTLTAALQWAPDIRVNGIAPGPVLPPVGMENSRMEKTLKTLPLPHPVDINDICRAALFLAESDSITGEIIHVDCGQHLIG